MVDKNVLLTFLKSKDLAILSTASLEGKTESAVMAITVRDDFTVLMNTESNARKVSNILNNPQASLVVGGLNSDPSVQIDGLCRVLDNQESQAAREFMIKIHPELKDYFSENSKFISLKPQWFRWSDYGQAPPEIVEFKN